jgi:hypothetical protein
MGTRAIIKVEGVPEVQVYKHYDGYPEGTLPWLKAFNKTFAETRGYDPGYKLAQLLRSSIADAEKFGLDTSKTTGWGVFPVGPDMGEEYVYTLHADGSVTYE